jgi:hypothetical protein
MADSVNYVRRVAVPLLSLWIPIAALMAQPTVRITSPQDGAIVNGGETLIVTVDATPLAFLSVTVGAGCDIAGGQIGRLWTRTVPPYEFPIPIPSDVAPQPCVLIAAGVIGAGREVVSEEIKVYIERPDSPKLLKNVWPTIILRPPIHRESLMVTGVFADGSEFNLTLSKRTKYVSDAPAVASVTADGWVEAVGPGKARITITNGSASVVVPVTVANKRTPKAPRQ